MCQNIQEDIGEPQETRCPNCKKIYVPSLERPMGDNRCIQDIYPDSQPWEREQLLSGICSDKCWDEYIGVEDEEAKLDESNQ